MHCCPIAALPCPELNHSDENAAAVAVALAVAVTAGFTAAVAAALPWLLPSLSLQDDELCGKSPADESGDYCTTPWGLDGNPVPNGGPPPAGTTPLADFVTCE